MNTKACLAGTLLDLQQVLAAMGANFAGLNARTEELRHRLDEGAFRLAVLGQFKRGKSSLLNALLGEPLLPTGVLPVTAIPTILRCGPERRARVSFLDGRCEDHSAPLEVLAKVLTHYVTEGENPANRLGVTKVEVEHPAGLLAKGVEIIDTPGIGSTVPHNTQAARDMLPVCDAALFVLSPDPPITEVEVQFLRAVKDAVARVLFVLTKADLLSPTERHEMIGFVQRVLQEQAGFSGRERIFPVSAHQGVQAHSTGSAEAWSQSNLGELEQYLTGFLLTEKADALHDAIRAKGGRVIREALFALELQRKAIELPHQELERRHHRFEAQLAKFDRERVYFRDRLAGDRQRLLEELDGLAEDLAQRAREALTGRLRRPGGEAHAALSAEVERFFGRVETEMPATVAARFHAVQTLHCQEVETLIEQIRRTAADLFEVPCLEGVALEGWEMLKEARIFRQRWITSFTEEAASLMTGLLPRALRAKRLERRLRQDIEYLVARNVEELRWATRQNLEDAIRGFQARMDAQIESTIAIIRSAVDAAMAHQGQRASQMAPELQRLEGHRQRLAQLAGKLSPDPRASLQTGPV
jgi:GTPase Era involved in 16S rRNA processing